MTSVGARVLVNVALLALAAALALFIWLDPWRQPEPAAEKLSAIDPTRVLSLRIEGPNRPPIELRREQASWSLIAPLSMPADEHRVAALLGLAAAAVHEAFRAEGNDLSEFGLKPPRARVLMDEREFRFGETEPLNGWRYVQYGDDVHLITDAYFHHLLASPAAFVDPALLGPDPRPVGFELGGKRLALEDGLWRLEPPEAGFDPEDGERLAGAWTSARAAAVKPYDPGIPWEQSIQVSLAGADGRLSFEVARLEHELVLGRPESKVQYHFPLRAGRRLVALGD